MATAIGLVFLALVAAAFAVLVIRRFRVPTRSSWRDDGDDDGPEGAGVREPRRPGPRSGVASAVAERED